MRVVYLCFILLALTCASCAYSYTVFECICKCLTTEATKKLKPSDPAWTGLLQNSPLWHLLLSIQMLQCVHNCCQTGVRNKQHLTTLCLYHAHRIQYTSVFFVTDLEMYVSMALPLQISRFANNFLLLETWHSF